MGKVGVREGAVEGRRTSMISKWKGNTMDVWKQKWQAQEYGAEEHSMDLSKLKTYEALIWKPVTLYTNKILMRFNKQNFEWGRIIAKSIFRQAVLSSSWIVKWN